jgi:hypothetical protein
MRSLIRLSVTLLICLIVVGLYQGWFSLSNPTPETEGSKVNVSVSVDKGKMKSDLKTAGGKIKEEVRKLEAKALSKTTEKK